MKRYDLRIVSRYSADGEGDIETDAEMRPSERGEWVKFADLQAAPQPPALGGELKLPERRDWVDGIEYHVTFLGGWNKCHDAFMPHVARLQAEVERLTALLDTPHTEDWFEGVKLESGHQIKRWGTEHDAGKTPADWFWLIGYLSQKAMTAQMAGDDTKARHHTISTGAAMLNWFRAIVGDSNAMRPGIDAALVEGK